MKCLLVILFPCLAFAQYQPDMTFRNVKANVNQVFNVQASPYGAKGDSTTDDYAAIQRAFTAAVSGRKAIVFPSGTYRIDSSLVLRGNNIELRFDPGARILGNTRYRAVYPDSGRAIIDIYGDSIRITGGEIRGQWIYAQRNDDSTKIWNQYGIVIHPDSNRQLSNFLFENLTIRGVGHYAVLASSNPNGLKGIANVTFRDCHFTANYGGMYLANGRPVVDAFKNWMIDHCDFDSSAGPPIGTAVINDTPFGLNHIFTSGAFNNLTIQNSFFDHCGRMVLEIWVNIDSVRLGTSLVSPKVTIQNNYIGTTTGRTLSITALKTDITNNLIEAPDGSSGYGDLEFSGRDLNFSRNTVYGVGFDYGYYGQEPDTTSQPDTVLFEQINVRENRFYDTDSTNHPFGIQLWHARNFNISDNMITVSNRTLDIAGAGTDFSYPYTAPLRVEYGTNGVIRDNTIYVKTPNWDRHVGMAFDNLQRVKIEGNTLRFKYKPIKTDTSGWPIWWFNGLTNCSVKNNKFMSDADSIIRLPRSAVVGTNNIFNTRAFKYTWVAASKSWTKTSIYGAPANSPPGSPSTDSLYLVGDTPTGAWANQARTIAVFNGTWSFSTVKDYIGLFDKIDNKLPSSHYTDDPWFQTELPYENNTNGDIIVAISNSFIRTDFIGNDFSGHGKARGENYDTTKGYEFRPSISSTIVWKSTIDVGEANWDFSVPVIRQIYTVPFYADSIPSSESVPRYFIRGQKALKKNPVYGKEEGWICTTTGTPGTWHKLGNVPRIGDLDVTFLGSELVTYGTFVDGTGWTVSPPGTWTFAGGVAVYDGTEISHALWSTLSEPLSSDDTYRLSFTVSACDTSSYIAVSTEFAASTTVTSGWFENGTYTVDFSNNSGTRIVFNPGGGSAFNLDNASIKCLTRAKDGDMVKWDSTNAKWVNTKTFTFDSVYSTKYGNLPAAADSQVVRKMKVTDSFILGSTSTGNAQYTQKNAPYAYAFQYRNYANNAYFSLDSAGSSLLQVSTGSQVHQYWYDFTPSKAWGQGWSGNNWIFRYYDGASWVTKLTVTTAGAVSNSDSLGHKAASYFEKPPNASNSDSLNHVAQSLFRQISEGKVASSISGSTLVGWIAADSAGVANTKVYKRRITWDDATTNDFLTPDP